MPKCVRECRSGGAFQGYCKGRMLALILKSRTSSHLHMVPPDMWEWRHPHKGPLLFQETKREQWVWLLASGVQGELRCLDWLSDSHWIKGGRNWFESSFRTWKLLGAEVSFAGWKESRRCLVVTVAQQCKCTQCHQSVHLTIVTMVRCCVLDHSFLFCFV